MNIGLYDLNIFNVKAFRNIKPSKYGALICGYFINKKKKLKANIEVITDPDKMQFYDQVYVINDNPNLKYNYKLFYGNCYFVGDYWPEGVRYFNQDWWDVELSLQPYIDFWKVMGKLNSFNGDLLDGASARFYAKQFIVKGRNGEYLDLPELVNLNVLDNDFCGDIEFLKHIKEYSMKNLSFAYPIELDLQDRQYMYELIDLIVRFKLVKENSIYIKADSIKCLKDLDLFFTELSRRHIIEKHKKIHFYYYSEIKTTDLKEWIADFKKFFYIRDHLAKTNGLSLSYKALNYEMFPNQNFMKVLQEWGEIYKESSVYHSFAEYLIIMGVGTGHTKYYDSSTVLIDKLIAFLHDSSRLREFKMVTNHRAKAFNYFLDDLVVLDVEFASLAFKCSYIPKGLKV